MRRTAPIARLEDHPNRTEVLGVLGQLARVTDEDLPRLAGCWRNNALVAQARDRALSPDSPLVLEVLTAFETVSELFADDVRGTAPYLTVPPAVALLAVKAVRDAVAAAFARPVLAPGEHAALLRPWRAVYPRTVVTGPDLGPRGEQVSALLAALPRLAARCHDPQGRRLWEQLASWPAGADRGEARACALDAAVLTGRRRVWTLVRRSGAQALAGPCPPCRARPAGDTGVRELCLDAAGALLVADALPVERLALLTAPLALLLPAPRDRQTG